MCTRKKKKDGRSLASLQHNIKAGLEFFSCRTECLGSTGIKEFNVLLTIKCQILISVTLVIKWNNSTEFTKGNVDVCDCIRGQYLAFYSHINKLFAQLSRSKGFI